MISRLVASLAALLYMLSAHPALGANDAKPTVEKVLAFYQTEAALGDALTYVEEALVRRRKEISIPEEHQERLLSLARRIYRKKNLYDVFKVAYAKSTTQEAMKALFEWQISVKGTKLRQGFTKLYDETPKAWKAYFEKESLRSLKPNRNNALTTFVTSTQLFEVQVGKAAGGDLAVHMGLNALAPVAGRDSAKILKERSKTHRLAHVESARTNYLSMAFFMLREVKNEEIDELSHFATTPTGAAATQAYLKALELTFDSAASTLAAQLAKGGGNK